MGNHQSSTCSNEQRRRTRSGIGRSGGPYVFDASGEGWDADADGDIEVDGGTGGHMADLYQCPEYITYQDIASDCGIPSKISECV